MKKPIIFMLILFIIFIIPNVISITPNHDYIFSISSNASGSYVLKYEIGTDNLVATSDVFMGDSYSLLVLNDYVYTYYINSSVIYLVELNKSDLSFIRSSPLNIPSAIIYYMEYDDIYENHFFIGTSQLYQINIETLNITGLFTTESVGIIRGGVIDKDYIYLAGTGRYVRKYYRNNLTSTGIQSTNYDHNIYSMISDDDYVYIGGGSTGTSRNMRQINKSDLNYTGVVTANYGGNILTSSIYNNIMYVGGTLTNRVRLYNLSNNLVYLSQTATLGSGSTINKLLIYNGYLYYAGELNRILYYTLHPFSYKPDIIIPASRTRDLSGSNYFSINAYTNGDTIFCPDGEVGQVFNLNGINYTIVDDVSIRELDVNNDDFTSICTSLVTDMSNLFAWATNFNQDIGSWDVSNVNYFSYMFDNAESFNQDISNWDMSNALYTNGMFSASRNFNQDISNWDMSNVVFIEDMFRDTDNFNQPIGNWNISGITSLWQMFTRATSFNQDLCNWDVSSVTDFTVIFSDAYNFNQPLNCWDMSSATSISNMFVSTNFNHPLDNWNVSNVNDFSAVFGNNNAFNQDISMWDVSKGENFQLMFYSSNFNYPIGDWNTSSATNMFWMFNGAFNFNQDISNWDFSNVNNLNGFIINNNAVFNVTNYDLLLDSLASQSLQNGVTMDVNSNYSLGSSSSRDYLISNFGWTINDLGLSGIVGCMDDSAYNYDEFATIDEDNCIYLAPPYADDGTGDLSYSSGIGINTIPLLTGGVRNIYLSSRSISSGNLGWWNAIDTSYNNNKSISFITIQEMFGTRMTKYNAWTTNYYDTGIKVTLTEKTIQFEVEPLGRNNQVHDTLVYIHYTDGSFQTFYFYVNPIKPIREGLFTNINMPYFNYVDIPITNAFRYGINLFIGEYQVMRSIRLKTLGGTLIGTYTFHPGIDGHIYEVGGNDILTMYYYREDEFIRIFTHNFDTDLIVEVEVINRFMNSEFANFRLIVENDVVITEPIVVTRSPINLDDKGFTMRGAIDEIGSNSLDYRFDYRKKGINTWSSSGWRGTTSVLTSFSWDYRGYSSITSDTEYEYKAVARDTITGEIYNGNIITTKTSPSPSPPILEPSIKPNAINSLNLNYSQTYDLYTNNIFDNYIGGTRLRIGGGVYTSGYNVNLLLIGFSVFNDYIKIITQNYDTSRSIEISTQKSDGSWTEFHKVNIIVEDGIDVIPDVNLLNPIPDVNLYYKEWISYKDTTSINLLNRANNYEDIQITFMYKGEFFSLIRGREITTDGFTISLNNNLGLIITTEYEDLNIPISVRYFNRQSEVIDTFILSISEDTSELREINKLVNSINIYMGLEETKIVNMLDYYSDIDGYNIFLKLKEYESEDELYLDTEVISSYNHFSNNMYNISIINNTHFEVKSYFSILSFDIITNAWINHSNNFVEIKSISGTLQVGNIPMITNIIGDRTINVNNTYSYYADNYFSNADYYELRILENEEWINISGEYNRINADITFNDGAFTFKGNDNKGSFKVRIYACNLNGCEYQELDVFIVELKIVQLNPLGEISMSINKVHTINLYDYFLEDTFDGYTFSINEFGFEFGTNNLNLIEQNVISNPYFDLSIYENFLIFQSKNINLISNYELEIRNNDYLQELIISDKFLIFDNIPKQIKVIPDIVMNYNSKYEIDMTNHFINFDNSFYISFEDTNEIIFPSFTLYNGMTYDNEYFNISLKDKKIIIHSKNLDLRHPKVNIGVTSQFGLAEQYIVFTIRQKGLFESLFSGYGFRLFPSSDELTGGQRFSRVIIVLLLTIALGVLMNNRYQNNNYVIPIVSIILVMELIYFTFIGYINILFIILAVLLGVVIGISFIRKILVGSQE